MKVPQLRQRLLNCQGIFEEANKANGTQVCFESELSFFMRLVSNNSDFLRCSESSLVEAFLNIAKVGLSIDPKPLLAYIGINYDIGCAEFGIGYRGYYRLGARSGHIKSTIPELIYEKDKFEFRGSDSKVLHHVSSLSQTERGQFAGGYCTTHLNNGQIVTTTMSPEEIMAIESVGQQYQNSAWNSVFNTEMKRKTLLRRHWKTLAKILDNLNESNYLSDFMDEEAPVKSLEHVQGF